MLNLERQITRTSHQYAAHSLKYRLEISFQYVIWIIGRLMGVINRDHIELIMVLFVLFAVAKMGNAASDLAASQKAEVNELLTVLENKLESFELEVELKRGLDLENKKEVADGRTVMRVSEIRVAPGDDISPQLTAAIADFFAAASA